MYDWYSQHPPKTSFEDKMNAETMEKLQKSTQRFGVEIYFSANETVGLVDYCEQLNLAVIGIEGFYQKATGIVSAKEFLIQKMELIPDVDFIVDFSPANLHVDWNEFRPLCNRQIENLLKTIRQTKEPTYQLCFTFLSYEEFEGS